MKSFLTAAIVGIVITTVVAAQRARPPAPPVLPPISMTCVHHPDVLESKPGTCPYCKLPLVPVRLDAAWMCPVHTTVTESSAGTCRMCGRQLVPVTVSLTWTCSADRATEHLEPGTCADGSPRIGRRTLRAHGANRTRAARELGISRATLIKKIRDYELGERPSAASRRQNAGGV